MGFAVHTGTQVVQVTATDADDPTYGNSARVIYSIIEGQPYFSVEPKTGTTNPPTASALLCPGGWSDQAARFSRQRKHPFYSAFSGRFAQTWHTNRPISAIFRGECHLKFSLK